MTKEEILWLKPQRTPDNVTMKGALQAMDEYAKQQAMAYCGWYGTLGFLPKVKDAKDYVPGESYMKSHEELYDQFIEQQNKP